MSDAVAADAAHPTAGALLRQAREEAGLHVASLAGMLKVPQRQIEALEQDRLDQLPDVVYARALAASVCRNLKVDPRSILERLPRGGDSRLGRTEPINLPFRTHDASQSGVLARLRGRPAAAVALLLLLGAAVLLLLPRGLQESPPPATTDAAMPAMQTPAVAAAPGVVTESVQPAPPPASSMPAAAAPGASAAGVAPAAATATPVSPAAPATLAPSSEAPASGAAMVEFRATQSSWVSVTDARGTVLLRRTLAAGEQVALNGVAPLAVTVGSVTGMQVLVRGRSLELNAARGVARFEVR